MPSWYRPLLLWSRFSARMRDIAEGITRSRFWQVPIYIAQYVLVTAVLTFPMTIYENYFREHAYGLSNQNFLEWFGDFATGFGVGLVVFVVLGTLIYSAIRGAKGYWWAWASAITFVFLIVGVAVAPVFISPLFNHYQPVKEGPVKDHILSLARSEGIPVTNVYEFDASRQSKRISANVSDFWAPRGFRSPTICSSGRTSAKCWRCSAMRWAIMCWITRRA